MIFFNKKGQIGKLISSMPLMILIFIIMGIFIFLALSMSVNRSASNSAAFVQNLHIDDVMTKEVVIKVDGQLQKMQLLEAVKIKATDDINAAEKTLTPNALFNYRIEGGDFGEIAKQLITPDRDCLYVFASTTPEKPSNAYIHTYIYNDPIMGVRSVDDAGPTSGPDSMEPYDKLGMDRTLSLSTKSASGKIVKIYINYYYGRCMECTGWNLVGYCNKWDFMEAKLNL
jgi:hypothetical protein